ncbi:MAG TPA: hydroxysqualene dehydroxylase HpnE [Candidatus Angelobacter sp.]|jgi:zeta-carotene desaturase|nr:hydroxysqualene dehydroxylase HpnE [Candidatus Angelobacter sp.]
MTADTRQYTVAIVGGGLAGLAAGCALADAGMRVTVFERRPYVGGRASSYEHPGTGEVVDNCQHVLLGCCTNLIDFYGRLGVSGKIRWFDELTFIEPGGRTSRMAPSFLPAPMHNVPTFLGAKMLNLNDKIAITRAMSAMSRGLPEDSSEDFLSWLRRHKQTEQAIERFWKTVLVSALNEDLNRISVRYAAQVFRESFMKSAAAGRMGLPSIPLSDLYGNAIEYIRARDGEVLLRSSVTAIGPKQDRAGVLIGSGEQQFDFAVLAAPFQNVANLLPSDESAKPIKQQLAHFEASSITGIHLWFDREITPLPHAVLLDRTIQWMFHKSKFHESKESVHKGSYLELVVSASKSLVQKSREEILELATRELTEFFPAVRDAKLVKATVIKEIYATYAILPGLDKYRPMAKTQWPRIFLAGDWTSTGWPATMEGAVRSGYLAAEALMESLGRGKKFVVADLPATGFMKLFW